MKSKDPDKVLKETVEKTIDVVDDYVEPGPRNAEEAVQKVVETIDNSEVKDALDKKRDEAIDDQGEPLSDHRSPATSH